MYSCLHYFNVAVGRGGACFVLYIYYWIAFVIAYNNLTQHSWIGIFSINNMQVKLLQEL